MNYSQPAVLRGRPLREAEIALWTRWYSTGCVIVMRNHWTCIRVVNCNDGYACEIAARECELYCLLDCTLLWPRMCHAVGRLTARIPNGLRAKTEIWLLSRCTISWQMSSTWRLKRNFEDECCYYAGFFRTDEKIICFKNRNEHTVEQQFCEVVRRIQPQAIWNCVLFRAFSIGQE